MNINSKVVFGNVKLKEAFNKLKDSRTEDKRLHEWMIRAFQDLENNAFCATQISKKLIPKEYIQKFGELDNLWKYDLPNGWRLIYTVQKDKVIILSIVLEWMNHKDYEKRFGY